MEASPSTLLTSVTSQVPTSFSTLSPMSRYFNLSDDQFVASRSVLKRSSTDGEETELVKIIILTAFSFKSAVLLYVFL